MFRRRSRDAGRPGSAGSAAGDEPDFPAGPEDLDEEAEPWDESQSWDEAEPEGEADTGDEAEAAQGSYQERAASEEGPASAGLDDGEQVSRVNLGDPDTWTRAQRAQADPGRAGGRMSGPWDSSQDYPQRTRIDFGSMLVPTAEGIDIQVSMAEDQGIWITVLHRGSELQLQAFAAPKSSGLWDEVREEIAAEVAKSGGDSQERSGRFGAELLARVRPQAEGQQAAQLQPIRFLGADGPRWFLRGMVTGPAVRQDSAAAPLEEIFADVVVVRGDHPAPPRDQLMIQLPEDAQRALEAQLEEENMIPNPFVRGPEITETR
ncbi:MAG TPA: DUF3710 domain-containing protein [Streptosporangiaceae bacterium]